MSNLFIVSDTHFGHRNIIKYENVYRPFNTIEEHDETIISNWNSIVSKRDVVIHLGDVGFGSQSLSTIDRCNGIKKLILGNHDRYPIEKYQPFFTKIFSSLEFNGCIFTHIPVATSELDRFGINVHGHTHSIILEDERYINACLEVSNLYPIPIENINKIIKEIR
jgi:calcineurin-like phosphoesterase family protein